MKKVRFGDLKVGDWFRTTRGGDLWVKITPKDLSDSWSSVAKVNAEFNRIPEVCAYYIDDFLVWVEDEG